MIQQLFEEQAERTLDSLALVAGDEWLTYRMVNERANRLATMLRHKFDIRPNDQIGVLLDRTEQLVIGLLAILKEGAAYTPINPNYPSSG